MRKQTKSSRQEFWRQVLGRQKATGLSVHRFCEREELAGATLCLEAEAAAGREG